MGWNVNQEHRQSRRVSVELPVQFTILNASGTQVGESLTGITTNVSASGLAFFVTSISLPIHTRVRIEMNIPGLPDPLRAEGPIVRIMGDAPQQDGFEYGVRLDKAEPADALERFVRSIDILPLLKLMVKQGATDLHLSVMAPPLLRVNRNLVAASDKPLSAETVDTLVQGVMSPQQRRELFRRRDVSFPLTVPEVGRWQVNVFFQRGYIEATFHTINKDVPTLEQLGLPETVRDFALMTDGLVLVTGPLASGKSTTLAALVGTINRETRRAVMTIEDPVEFAFENQRSVVKQREVGRDTRSFADGLRHALTQDSDVIVATHVRDAESAELIIRAAETGRLVITTLPSLDAMQAIERLVAFLPAAQRQDGLHAVASSLRGVVSQRLLPQADGRGLALASEVVTVNDGIRNAVRTDKVEQIPNLMRSAPGAQPLDVSLRALVLRRVVDLEVAAMYAADPDRLRKAAAELRA
jgi:twitching motility protein PilT